MAEITHNASSVTLTAGTLTDGNVTSTFVKGDAGINNTYNWSAVAEIPGFDVRFNVSNVTENRNSYILAFYAVGDAAVNIVNVQAYNFTGSTWDTIGTTNEFLTYDWFNNSVYSQDYISGNEMWIRVYRTDRGNPGDDYAIDYFQIVESDAGSAEEHYEVGSCPITDTPSTLLYIFIGVMIVVMFIIGEWTRVPIFNVITGLGLLFYSFPLYGCNFVYGGTITIFAIMVMGYSAFWKWR